MKKQLLLCLSFLMITAFTGVSAQTGTINIVSIQSPIEVGASGTITLTYTSTVPCYLNTTLRETNPNLNTVNWTPWHGQQDVTGLPIAATATTVTFNYAIPASEVSSASLATSKPGVQFTFAFSLRPTAGGGGFAFRDSTAANLVTLNPSSVVTNSVNITSVASTISAGSNLTVNFNYTLASAGKVKVEVRRFNGTTYIGGAAGLIIDTYIDPAAATTSTPVAATKTLTIPFATPLSSSLTNPDNYKVVVTIYTSVFAYISDKKSDLTITAISETTWNGSAWSNGTTPSSTIEAFIAGAYTTTANGAFTAKKLTVNSGSLTINSGTNLNITNEVINNAGTNGIVIENNANLIQVNNVANTGVAVVKRNSNPLYRLDYTLWSSPTGVTQTMIGFSPLTTTGRFYEYNPTSNLYSVVGNAIPFSQGKGFLIRMPNEDPSTLGAGTPYATGATPITYDGVFTGIPNNGNVTIAGTSGQYVAVGNPYPSTISADLFIDANSAGTGAGTLYFWRKTNVIGGGGTAYATYTKAGPVGVPAGSGTANGGFTPTADIAVGQGFITTVPASNTIAFTNALRTSSNSAQFLRTKAATQKDRVWLNLSAGTNPVNQMMVAYMDGATQGVDSGIDGKYINDNPTALTSDINNEEYVIQGRPAFNDTDIVNLNFKTDVAGNFTIAIDHVDGLFVAGQAIYLVDKTTGAETNLQTDAYTFTSAIGVFNSRFQLTYKTSGTLNVNSAVFNENSIYVYKLNGVLNINAGKTTMKNVKVFDITGRLILEQKEVNATTTSLKNLAIGKQTLLIQITADDNKVVTKKAIY